MSVATHIQWTQATWNPIAGCTPVSPGCLNCYAAKQSYRLERMGQAKYRGLTLLHNGRRTFNGRINFDEDALSIPLRRRKPTMFFVNSMSDLFHEDVPAEFIYKVFAVMASCERHVFQVLTKRPEQMAEDMNRLAAFWLHGRTQLPREVWNLDAPWPLPNVWLGCSPVNQKTFDEYAPHIRRCPAAVRFLSLEPLLGPIDLGDDFWESGNRVEWVIVGNESIGNGVGRFADGYEAAARSIIQQCAAAGVACFHKQMPIGNRTSGEPQEWPEDLRVREMPAAAGEVARA